VTTVARTSVPPASPKLVDASRATASGQLARQRGVPPLCRRALALRPQHVDRHVTREAVVRIDRHC
jgi:hypothetical protein